MKKTRSRLVALLLCVLMLTNYITPSVFASETNAESSEALNNIEAQSETYQDDVSDNEAAVQDEASEDDAIEDEYTEALQGNNGAVQSYASNEFNYTLINEVLESGFQTTAVVIDMEKDIEESSIMDGTFYVYATIRNAATGIATAENVRRLISGMYVSDEPAIGKKNLDSGRYIIIELTVGTGVEGTSASVGGAQAILEYSLVQRFNIVCVDETLYTPGSVTYRQDNVVNLVVDDFEAYTYHGAVLDTPYQLFTPENPDDELMPLVIWFHGGGSQGTDNYTPLVSGNRAATAWAEPENQAVRPCYVLIPQTNTSWNADDADNVVAIIQDLIQNGNVDPDRVYILGGSRGGVGVLRTAYLYPEVFAAGIPISTSHDFDLYDYRVAKLIDIPLWFVCASNDDTVPPPLTRGRVQTMASAGGLVRYTEFPDVYDYRGHFSWIHVANNEYSDKYDTDFMTWLFEQRKSHPVEDYDFQVVTKTYDYGKDTIAVTIDAGAPVDASSISADTFDVTTVNCYPDSDANAIEYSGLRRITNAYVSESGDVGEAASSGQYIILELEKGEGVEGAATTANGKSLIMYYEVQQLDSFTLSDGTTVEAGTVHYNDTGEVEINEPEPGKTVTVTFTTYPKRANLTVWDADDNEVTANDNGTYDLADGDYSYEASMPGYKNGSGSFTVENGELNGLEAITLTADVNQNTFSDVDWTQWYKNAVIYSVANNLFKGTNTEGTTWEPDTALTRAMFVTALGKYSGIEGNDSATCAFDDVDNGKWYTGFVQWASDEGLVEGVGDNKFEPNRTITRQEMAVIFWKYVNKTGADMAADAAKYNNFPDKGETASWAVTALTWATDRGVINGDDQGRLLPTGTATRAQTAQVFMVIIEDIL